MAQLSITAANVQPDTDAVTENVVLGENLTAGKVVYKKSTENYRVRLAFPQLPMYASEVAGVMLSSGGEGQPGVIQVGGTIIVGSVVTVGRIYVLSPLVPAGGFSPISDLSGNDYVTLLGIGVAVNKIQLGILASGVLR